MQMGGVLQRRVAGKTRFLLGVVLLLAARGDTQGCDLPTVQVKYGFSVPTEISPALDTRIVLQCVASPSTDVTSYFWQKNGLNTETVLQYYFIQNLQTSDGGVYHCGVQTSCGTTPSTNDVSINTPPSITQLSGGSVVTEGESFRLSCSADGWPQPTIEWYLNGSLLHTGGVYAVSMASSSDSGQYTCEAKNTRDRDAQTHNLTVEAAVLPTPLATVTLPLPASTPVTVMETNTPEPTTDDVTGTDDGTVPPSTTQFPTATVLPTSTELPTEEDNRLFGPIILILAMAGLLTALLVLLLCVILCLVCYEIGRRPQKRKTNVSDETRLLEDGEMPDRGEEEGKKEEERRGERERSGLSCVNLAFLPDTSSTDESEPSSMHDLDADGTGHLLEPQRYTLSVESAKRSSKRKKRQHQQQQNAAGQIPHSLSSEVKRTEMKRSSQKDDSVPWSVSMVDPRELEKQQQQKDRLSVPEPTTVAATEVEMRREEGAMVELGERKVESRPVSEEVKGKRAPLPRGEVRRSTDIEPTASEVHVQVVAKELPISEALAAEPTVTTFKPEVGGVGEAVTTTALTISERTGETTITMQQEEPSLEFSSGEEPEESEKDEMEEVEGWEGDEERLLQKEEEEDQVKAEEEEEDDQVVGMEERGAEEEEEGEEEEDQLVAMEEEEEEEEEEGDEEPNVTRMSVFVDKAKRLGRTLSFVKQLDRSHPLNLAEIHELIDDVEGKVERGHPLMIEYQTVPFNSVQSMKMSVAEKHKNRYRNVLPNPHSAVKLRDMGEDGSTYINANFIRGYGDKEKAYIATQGPITETVPDFWRMVWEQNVSIIIMTTGLVERGMHKCTKYWPSFDDPAITTYGEISIRNNFEEVLPYFKIAYLTIYPKNEGMADAGVVQERDVFHFWFTAWPDFGVPKETASILKLREAMNSYRGPETGPVVVHCSAGLGRSGTFMGIDMGIQQYDSEGIVDPLKFMCEMRQDRGGSVQNVEQYAFIHRVLADYMASRLK